MKQVGQPSNSNFQTFCQMPMLCTLCTMEMKNSMEKNCVQHLMMNTFQRITSIRLILYRNREMPLIYFSQLFSSLSLSRCSLLLCSMCQARSCFFFFFQFIFRYRSVYTLHNGIVVWMGTVCICVLLAFARIYKIFDSSSVRELRTYAQ